MRERSGSGCGQPWRSPRRDGAARLGECPPDGPRLRLRAVADRLSACVRETDTVARLGGDEFAILQSALDRDDDAEILAQRILKAVGAPYDLGGYRAVIGISIGIAVAPRDGSNMEGLLKTADVALYRAKSEGPNAYRFFRASGVPERDVREISGAHH